MLTFSRIARSTAWYLGALVVQKGISFFYFSYLARRIGVESTGAYTLVLSYTAFFGAIVDLGLSQVIIRELSANFSKLRQVGFALLVVRVVLGVVVAVCAYMLAPLFGLGNYLNLVALGVCVMLGDSLSLFFYSILRATQNLKWESIGVLVFQIVTVVIGGTLLARGIIQLPYFIGALLIASIVNSLFAVMVARIKYQFSFSWHFDRAYMMTIAKSALFFFMSGILIKLYNVQDSVIINKLTSPYELGLYALPQKVMFTWPFLALAFSGSMYPALSHFFSTDAREFRVLFWRYFGIMCAISIPLALGLFFGARFALMTFWPAFNQSLQVWRALALGLPLLFIEFPLGAVLNASHHERWNMSNRLVQVVLAIGLNIVCVPRFGIMGAVFSYFVANAVLVALGMYKTLRVLYA